MNFILNLENDKEITIDDIIANISLAFESLSGNEISYIHNEICDANIEYKGDDTWKVVDFDSQK